jgi:rhodanese-related sulfurtransferase
VIDVREPHEFVGELGHLPGALLVPIGTLPASAREWRKDEPVLMVCRSGARSARAAEILVEEGFESVLNLEGGMIAVNAKKLPVER